MSSIPYYETDLYREWKCVRKEDMRDDNWHAQWDKWRKAREQSIRDEAWRVKKEQEAAKQIAEDAEDDEIQGTICLIIMGIKVIKGMYDDPKKVEDAINFMYKRFLGQQEYVGTLSLGKKALHKLYKGDPTLPDPRPLFKQKPEPDWYASFIDGGQSCVIEDIRYNEY